MLLLDTVNKTTIWGGTRLQKFGADPLSQTGIHRGDPPLVAQYRRDDGGDDFHHDRGTRLAYDQATQHAAEQPNPGHEATKTGQKRLDSAVPCATQAVPDPGRTRVTSIFIFPHSFTPYRRYNPDQVLRSTFFPGT